jgi:hypothetical protein
VKVSDRTVAMFVAVNLQTIRRIAHDSIKTTHLSAKFHITSFNGRFVIAMKPEAILLSFQIPQNYEVTSTSVITAHNFSTPH